MEYGKTNPHPLSPRRSPMYVAPKPDEPLFRLSIPLSPESPTHGLSDPL